MSIQHDNVETKDQIIARLTAALLASKAQATRKLTLKVSAKGGVALYGLGKFPVTLYLSQWERLLGEVEHIKAFIDANREALAVKA